MLDGKTLIMVCALSFAAHTAGAQDTATLPYSHDTLLYKKPPGGNGKYCVTIIDGKPAVTINDIQVFEVIIFKDKSRLTPDGVWISRKGTPKKLHAGDCVDKSGILTEKASAVQK